MQDHSVLEDAGHYRSTCGYCDTNNSSVSHGASAQQLSVYTYQDLIDHGWRRSGTWLYQPNLKETCCKQYTIRLDVLKYKARHSQKKALRKWKAYIAGKAQANGDDHNEMDVDIPAAPQPAATASNKAGAVDTSAAEDATSLAAVLSSLVQQCVDHGNIPQANYPPATVKAPSAKQRRNLPQDVCFTTAIAFAVASTAVKAANVKLEAAHVADLLVNSFNAQSVTYKATATAGHINIRLTNPDNSSQPVTADSAPAPSGNTSTTNSSLQQTINQTSSSNIPSETPTQVPAAKSSKPSKVRTEKGMTTDNSGSGTAQGMTTDNPGSGAAPQQPVSKHEWSIVMLPSQFIKEEFELYKLYQTRVHDDEEWEVTRSRYKSFLVDSPLKHVPKSRDPNAPECGYGSFHQQYWLDGVLIAVGVVDVLPRCLSSVYFMWHPDYAELSLGRLSALKEIEWVQEAHRAGCAQLHYYYMGYYIHSCPKMKYKADYTPSELLCPKARVWVSLTDQLRTALDEQPYVVLSQLPGAVTAPNLAGGWTPAVNAEGQPEPQQQEVDNLQISTPSWGGRRMPWRELKTVIRPNLLEALEAQLRKFCYSAGPASAQITYLLS